VNPRATRQAAEQWLGTSPVAFDYFVLRVRSPPKRDFVHPLLITRGGTDKVRGERARPGSRATPFAAYLQRKASPSFHCITRGLHVIATL
jgi:hypothetical protein